MVSFSCLRTGSGHIAEPVARAQDMNRPAEGDHGNAEDRLPGPAGEKEGEDQADAGQEDHRAPGMEGRFDQRPRSAAPPQDEEARHGETQEGDGHEDEVGHDGLESANGDERHGEGRLEEDRAYGCAGRAETACHRLVAAQHLPPLGGEREGVVKDAERMLKQRERRRFI